jgi:hypothetical protein
MYCWWLKTFLLTSIVFKAAYYLLFWHLKDPMLALNMPALRIGLLIFLTGRSQITKIYEKYSSRLDINHSIVQGSCIGPSMYVLMESDLRTLCVKNVMFKFADDTSLLVPENSDVPMQDEFAHVQE